jgi:hypothetical protein
MTDGYRSSYQPILKGKGSIVLIGGQPNRSVCPAIASMKRVVSLVNILNSHQQLGLDALRLALAYHCGQPTQRIETEEVAPSIPPKVNFIVRVDPNAKNRT